MTRRVVPIVALLWMLGGGAIPAQEGPDYPHGDYEDDCTMCHSPEGWTPAVIGPEFNHAKRGFALEGAHAQTKCTACHASLEFNDAVAACNSCHSDVHVNEMGPDCAQCHTPRSFIDRSSMVRAHMTSRFPLRGAHRAVDCEECHVPAAQGALQWVLTPVDCESCHVDSYLATTNPDHQAAGFPRTCEACHAPRAWTPAAFNHAMLPVGTQCVSCHLDDYQATADPNHQTVGFNQQCETCHSTVAWTPASVQDHDGNFFPIYSGSHRGRWTRCSDCHVVPNSYASFECIQCHAHDDPNQMADKHSEVSGYQYSSQACFSCHPQGRKEN